MSDSNKKRDDRRKQGQRNPNISITDIIDRYLKEVLTFIIIVICIITLACNDTLYKIFKEAFNKYNWVEKQV